MHLLLKIARRMGYGKKIVMGDKKIENAKAIAEIMNNAIAPGIIVTSLAIDEFYGPLKPEV